MRTCVFGQRVKLVKQCKECKKILTLSCFSITKYKRTGKSYTRPFCKKCSSKKAIIWAKKNKIKRNLTQKEYRHREGESIRFYSRLEGETKRNKKLFHNQKYKYNKRNAGKLTIKVIQSVYENNIKKYGTLTCYLCLKPIEMQKEHLEHKTPLCRGGTNNYENLGVSCAKCNLKKGRLTEHEFRKNQ